MDSHMKATDYTHISTRAHMHTSTYKHGLEHRLGRVYR